MRSNDRLGFKPYARVRNRDFYFFAFTTFTVPHKNQLKTAISSVSSFLPKSALFLPFPALYHCNFTNVVPNTLINSSLTASYSQFCEGCESKKCKIAGCARARTRESPIFTLHFIVIFAPPLPPHFPSHLRAKKSQFPPQNTPSISSKNVRLHQKFIITHQKLCSHRAKRLSHQARYFLPQNTKNVGDNSKNLQRFSKNVRRFFENLPRF